MDSQIESHILSLASKKANIARESITGYRIVRESIDARRKDIKINLSLRLFVDEDPRDLFEKVVFPDVSNKKQVIVVGSGPAGLFASLTLVENGLKPIVIERGKNVHERAKDCAKLSTSGILSEDSNYAFGEGGAGAFSDGKLYTRSVKRGDVKKVLSLFVQHGANDEILYQSHPHIGSDKLPNVIENIRNTLLSAGAEVHFNTKVISLIKKDDRVIGVRCENGEEFFAPVILATGHSAKDVYSFLDAGAFRLEAKDVAVGVRLEHPQALIDRMQYHSKEGRGNYLPPASYSFVTQVENRGVYSFCMCPGGAIIPASTEYGYQVVNGMSSSSRLGKKANAAFVVEIKRNDLSEDGPLSMLRYIEGIEKMCYIPGFKAPGQRMVDFVEGRFSQTIIENTYKPGVESVEMDNVLPQIVSNSLREAFKRFGKLSHGLFLTNDALLVATETRTSSPVRILRDDGMRQCLGLYPAGEGAGYAGGIVSAAIDGTEVAINVANDIKRGLYG